VDHITILYKKSFRRRILNPLMNDVFGAFQAIKDRPKSISIDRKGIALPAGGHFQGIQRVTTTSPRKNRLLVITSSSDHEGYFVTCSMAEDWMSGRANPPTVVSTSPDGKTGFNHAGGFQAFGAFLAIGAENINVENTSEVQFWVLGEVPERVPAEIQKTIERCATGHKCTAGAVGITSNGKGAVLAIGSYDCDTIDFYTCGADPFTGTPFQFLYTWSEDAVDNKDSWIDHNFGSYQNINLITDVVGNMFMVAFDRAGYSDWMDLYSVDLTAGPNYALRKLAKKHMYCTDGCEFDAGSGIFIASADEFDVYAVKPKSGDHETGTTIHINYFSAT